MKVGIIGRVGAGRSTFFDALTGLQGAARSPGKTRLGVAKVLELKPGVEHVLLVSSDIPTITSEMVDWVVNAALQTDLEAYYNVIPREVMEKRFPGSKRSYTRLRDVEVWGGDMNLIKTSLVTQTGEVLG